MSRKIIQIFALPYFGNGKEEIFKHDVLNALTFRNKFDAMIVVLVIVGVIFDVL